jgi:phage tail sheath protein FI
MPATYKSPGVYVEEVPPMSRPIAGVSTSTPGFIGIVPDRIDLPFKAEGRLKWLDCKLKSEPLKAYRISSWANYIALFGDMVADGESVRKAEELAKAVTDAETELKEKPEDADKKKKPAAVKTEPEAPKAAFLIKDQGTLSPGQRHLAHAVFGFFNNGGTSCYVVRMKGEASEIGNAFKALSAIEEISTVAAPGVIDCDAYASVISSSLIDHATKNQQFAILDFSQKDSIDGLSAKIQTSQYAAAYYPWLKVFDPAVKLIDSESDGTVLVPPSGHVAGVYARSDAARGAFKAPANEALLGVLGLVAEVARADQDGVNGKGVNVIRNLNGAVRIWGARTAGGDANGEYRYISTRRYFNYLSQSIDSGTQFVVFEPHTPALWQRVIRTLSDFLTNEWRAGGLFGETAKQAFFIKCDAETNPPETREQGQLIAEIGVAIVKPAEFVIFRIQQNSGN